MFIYNIATTKWIVNMIFIICALMFIYPGVMAGSGGTKKGDRLEVALGR